MLINLQSFYDPREEVCDAQDYPPILPSKPCLDCSYLYIYAVSITPLVTDYIPIFMRKSGNLTSFSVTDTFNLMAGRYAKKQSKKCWLFRDGGRKRHSKTQPGWIRMKNLQRQR